jgi:fumarate reductase subunit C
VRTLGTVEREPYRRYRPRWHRERMPIFWWLGRASYVGFIFRELTSLGVAYASLLLLLLVRALGAGEESAARFAERLASPWALAFHALVFAVILVHALSWLHLAPKALVVKLGGRRLPDRAVLAGHYLGWFAATALVVWILLGS